MLIPFKDLRRKFRIRVTGVLHLGAHLGEEAADYNVLTNNVTWVEANPELMNALSVNVMPFGHRVLCACVSDEAGKEVTFHVTNNFMSSSLLDLGTHKKSSPDVHYTHDLKLVTTTVDDLVVDFVDHEFNFLNMDLQGAEVLALKGASETIGKIDYVYSEVNTEFVYKNCGLIHELDEILSDFDRVETHMAGPKIGWGDAFWIRRDKH